MQVTSLSGVGRDIKKQVFTSLLVSSLLSFPSLSGLSELIFIDQPQRDDHVPSSKFTKKTLLVADRVHVLMEHKLLFFSHWNYHFYYIYIYSFGRYFYPK